MIFILQAEYLIHCGVKENRNGDWVRSTRHKVLKLHFGCNDDYESVRNRLLVEFELHDECENEGYVVLLNMVDKIIDEDSFSILGQHECTLVYITNH